MFPSSNEIHLKPVRNQCVLQSDVLPLELPLLLSSWRITPLEEEQQGAVKMLPPPICMGPCCFLASNNFLKKVFLSFACLGSACTLEFLTLVWQVWLYCFGNHYWPSAPCHCRKGSLGSCALPELEVLSAGGPLCPSPSFSFTLVRLLGTPPCINGAPAVC